MRQAERQGTRMPVVAAWLAMSLSLLCTSRHAPAAGRFAPARRPSPLVRRALAALDGAEEIVFAVRAFGRDGHWYANFGHHSRNGDAMQYGRDGGKLCRLNLRTGKVTTILDDPGGGVRDPCVHYDGGKILFSYRKAGSRHYKLHEVRADGGGLRRITTGESDEIEPIYLPDGDLMFCSSRCNRFVQCWFTQVAILYRSGPDGEDVRPVSANIEQDNTPWMMPDGRVLFMRWEYVDRSRVRYHHLWTVNPDGTGQMAFFGNMHPGTVMLDAKPIPGTNRVVSIFSPGHGRKEHAGRLAVIDPDAGPDERRWVRYVGRGGNYRDPYPLAEDLFLAAENNRLLLVDADGRTEAIHTAPGRGMMAHEPRPLRPRPREFAVPSRVNGRKTTGLLILADVAHGRRMDGVRAGEIKKLLILETLPKPVNFSGTMEPISLGGTFTLPRILGTVPVEPDGSAYFEVPALRPLFFVALDDRDLSVKRMQSFVSVMPGETTGCSGCHEHRTENARLKGDLIATRKPPARIQPIRDVPDVPDFPRDIQPILDRHCVRCHNYKQPPAAGLPLVGARSGWYSHSYYALMSRGLVSHGRDADGNKAPRTIGSAASRLLPHVKKRVSPLEYETVRLWIECGAPYPGTYAALGSGMVKPRADAGVLQRRCAGCHGRDGRRGARFKTPEELLYNLTDAPRSPLLLAPLAKGAGGWGLCKGPTAPREPPRLVRPRRKLVAAPVDPFARGDKGGRVVPLVKRPAKPGEAPARAVAADVVFRTAEDADYRKLLAGVRAAKDQLDRITRFDMPTFRPNEHYVREMKRYGILPARLDAGRDRIDPYATDQAYWRSFWCRPAAE